MKKSFAIRIAALKPRNPFVALARKRVSGAHVPAKRPRNDEQKDLLQRLREAGL